MRQSEEISFRDIIIAIKKNIKLLFIVIAIIMTITLSGLVIHHFTKPVMVTQQLRIGSYLSSNDRQNTDKKDTDREYTIRKTINSSSYVLNNIVNPLINQVDTLPNAVSITASKNFIKDPKGMFDKKGQPLKFYSPDDSILLLQATLPKKQLKSALNKFNHRCEDIAKTVKLSESEMLAHTKKRWKQQQTLNKLKLTLLKDTERKLAPLSSDSALKKTFQGQNASMASPQSDKTSNLFSALMTNDRITQFGLQANQELIKITTKTNSINDNLASLTPAHLIGKPFLTETKSSGIKYLLIAFMLSILLGLFAIGIKCVSESKSNS
jgi:hypothetical protein